MKLNELLLGAGYPEAECGNREITSVAFDTRAVREGSLFVALKGRKTDGHTLLTEAAKRGAVAAIVTDPQNAPLAEIPVPDTRRALARLSAAFYGHPSRELRTVAVTGTNGKTTVASLLTHFLTEAGMRVGMIGTVGNFSSGRPLDGGTVDPAAHMTTPDPPDLHRMLREMRNDGCTVAVLEATSHASALRKLDGIDFDTAVFTNLTRDHLDFHGTFERYFEAKAEYFGRTKRAAVALGCSIPLGDGSDAGERIAKIAVAAGAKTVTVSEFPDRNPDLLLSGICETEHGTAVTARERDGREHRFLSPLRGDYNAMNLLLAATAARGFGIPDGDLAASLGTFRGVRGRMEEVALGADFSVYIDFAHTPDALERVLKSARHLRRGKGRLTVLFGCGGDRDPTKRKEMGTVASRLADFVILTSDNSRSEDPDAILGEILRGVDKERPYRVIPSRREAIFEAVASAGAGDVLLLSGKGHEGYEIDRTGVHPFSERETVFEAYRARCGTE